MQLLLIAFSAWLIAQLIKFSIKALHGTPDFKLFYQSGGMPSAHAATVVALAIAAFTLEGYDSAIFGVAAVLAAIVIYDTLGVRRSSGEQSVMLNVLVRAFGDLKPIREVLGHTPKEVFVGVVIGMFVGFTFTFNAWAADAVWLTTPPPEAERLAYLGLFLGLTTLGVLIRVWLARYRKVATIRRLISASWWAVVTPGILGLFLSLLHFQAAGAASWRLWSLILITALVSIQAYLFFEFYRFAPSRYHEESSVLLKKRRELRLKDKKKKAKRSRR